ncbi:MAG: tryptophan synthase beta chain [Acidobacteriota bacterium]|jgi:tryptophan synthase beta chain
MIETYLNINALYNYRLFHAGVPVTKSQGNFGSLPRALSTLELSRSIGIPIPTDVLQVYSRFRPTPLFRAVNFEKAISTDCEIYVKDESRTPTGNHKANSAYLIAYLCRDEGLETLTTETTGNWGVALAIAAAEFGLQSISFLDTVSHRRRPDAASMIEGHGGQVVIVEQDNWHQDLLTLSADAAIASTSELDRAAYIFGSVYGYFVVPQSIMGLEAKTQLASLGKYPDIVIGSCGGGANLLGIAAPFLADHIAIASKCHIISAESNYCPVISCGKFGLHSIDSNGNYPQLETYGLPGLLGDEYIGGLGSTIVASAAAHFHQLGLIEAQVFTSGEAINAARLFEATEGLRVALETAYQLAAVVRAGQHEHKKTILVNVSSGKNDADFYLVNE